ncbi:hypothetical protein ACXYX3_13620 [Mycobacterium sp. C3-094]|uniref:hypothetical protein n=1 Tax=Mycobacterium sp. PSTR-4-N TaxID=2917745 RepID=UPI001F14DDDB|nr:hypothetical protein [Mycobacterium sp. PSTR-4-N]MCG7596485.1 hypothetical protein [Mycobacterium sp. PSTR-4-N]
MHDHADETASLADVSQIGDSPLLRAMSGEHISIEAHDDLVEIACYEERLDQQFA